MCLKVSLNVSVEPEDDPDRLARAALARAQALSGRYPVRSRRRQAPTAKQRSSRDPQLFGDAIEELFTSRGWDTRVRDASVMADWPEIVGAEIAQHCEVVSLEAEVLTLQADSTMWAQQLRLLSATILVKIAEKVGEDVVKDVKILAPSGPSWRKGQWRVQGRGPRDTYG